MKNLLANFLYASQETGLHENLTERELWSNHSFDCENIETGGALQLNISIGDIKHGIEVFHHGILFCL